MPGPDLLHRLRAAPAACAVVAATCIAAAADAERAAILAEEMEDLLAHQPAGTALQAVALLAAGLLEETRPGGDAATALGAFAWTVAELLGHVPVPPPCVADFAALEAAARSIA